MTGARGAVAATKASIVIRALGTLRPRDLDTLESCARVLNFAVASSVARPPYRETDASSAPTPEPGARSSPHHEPSPSHDGLRDDSTSFPPLTDPTTDDPGVPIPSRLQALEQRGRSGLSPELSDLTTGATTFASPSPRPTPRPPPSLLSPSGQTAMVVAMLSVFTASDRFDEELAVQWLALGRDVSTIPRVRRLSLRRGATVLVDLGEAMQPFVHDRDQIVEEARHIMGGGFLTVKGFRGTPLRGAGTGSSAAWTPPDIATSSGVLVISDLGRGHPSPDRAGLDEWASWLRLLAERDIVPVVLTPYPVDRLPSILRQMSAACEWDRSTNLGLVVHQIRLAFKESVRR